MSADPNAAYSAPMDVSVEDGEIVVLGPDGISGSFTPDAAEESARRLLVAVERFRSGRSTED